MKKTLGRLIRRRSVFQRNDIPAERPEAGALLDRLHTQSDAEVEETDAYFERRERKDHSTTIASATKTCIDSFPTRWWRSTGRRGNSVISSAVPCGSAALSKPVPHSGISTLYLAAAVRDNQVDNGVVIGTEHEPGKVEIALENFREAGLSDYIDLRDGDLRQTLRDPGGPVDFMLVDVWDVALPALELVSPSLRPGAIVVCDNTTVDAAEYRDYFEFINDPGNRFRTMTVPFQGGFELTVRV